MTTTHHKRKRLTIPYDVIIHPVMRIREMKRSDCESWLTSDFEYIKGQCGPEYGHVPVDDIRAQCGNLRRAGKLGKLTKGGHGQGPKKPIPSWYQQYLDGRHWQERRAFFLRLWNYQCVVCTRQANHVHHRHYNSLWRETEYDCIPLCSECHRKFHGRMNHVPNTMPGS